MMKTISVVTISLVAALAVPFSAQADTRKAFCQYFPNGDSKPKVSMPCTFSMRQGFIDVIWQDGVRDSFRPISGRPMVYTDDRGGIVYQQRGEEQADGTSARIMKMENGSIYIWGS
ncbi:hypothetical protein PseudUWO311_04445 [Pseudanabaena sp. UWO311]|uniref:hypothetical protein n=1 Tax=Pseudanabaena sp. UWO311 TaxID=2487337 RepID=UPI00115B56ED|nr:hypothetical protein [Pseudanabaena sp. UWO311]TYQ28743.1 hypothetical protein PseudUWO311_04445 [Pseudanabaena sp. UWO311]